MKRLASALVLFFALAPAATRAQSTPPDAPDVSRLFSHQARVVQLGASSYRLPLTADVLAVCRPGLSDVRLYDEAGSEIPWMLDSATRNVVPETEQLGESAAPVMQAVTHETEGPTRAPTAFHELYEIAGPGEPPSRARWDLLVGTTRDRFVTDAHVSALDGAAIGASSVYRFVAPTRELLRIPVDAHTSDHVRVDLRGRDGFLDPTFTWVATRRARAGEEMVIPLEIASSARDGTQTVLAITRPAGVVPELLRFTTSTGAFLRAVHVESGGRTIDDRIWRVPGTAEVLDVRAPAGREPTITVRIDDQDSPPLDALTVSAVISQPVLVYFAQASMLRFGGGRVRAPRYDLAALEGSWVIDQLLDGSQTPLDATLGPISESPGWTDAPALAALQRAGVAVPPGDHAFFAPLTVSAASEGASRFVLDPSVLGAARQDLADLRVVDAEGRQWPYLLRDVDPLERAVTLGAPASVDGETRYEILLPAPIVAASELRLDPDAALVSRTARVVGIDARGDESEIGAGSLDRYPGDEVRPLAIGLDASRRVSTLALLVTDGSETPLAFRSATLSIPTREVVLVAPPGSYRVLVGDDDAQPPTYEIESVRALLDTIPIDDAALGALAPNPAHHEPSLWERAGTSTLALWAVLILAILVLGALTWRASRSESENERESKSDDEA